MKKTFTFLYSPTFTFPDPFPNNDKKDIPNSLSSTNDCHFLPIRSSVIMNEPATLSSNSKKSCMVPFIPVTLNASSCSHERINLKQPTLLQLLQVFCVPVFIRERYLHSAFMSYKSMGLFFNPTSSFLNLI